MFADDDRAAAGDGARPFGGGCSGPADGAGNEARVGVERAVVADVDDGRRAGRAAEADELVDGDRIQSEAWCVLDAVAGRDSSAVASWGDRIPHATDCASASDQVKTGVAAK